MTVRDRWGGGGVEGLRALSQRVYIEMNGRMMRPSFSSSSNDNYIRLFKV